MFTKVPILMTPKDGGRPIQFDALINIAHIVTVFPYDEGRSCSTMLVDGGRVSVNLPFAEFSERLLELRKLTLDS